MSRLVARAESFERVYDAFNNINFAAFDYDTVKQSLLEYVKLYFPETFNDFIESSEFIAIVETFAYIAELMAYRLDVNAHENFISTAQRKDSILRLAKLVSYTASRPLPARGLVKITSVSTTESVIDANGINLANRKIIWNDVSNSSWKDQFILVMNRTMDQPFGTVGPSDRFQLQDVLFELYTWNLSPLPMGVFSYTALASGTTAAMELVPVQYDEQLSIIERRPTANSNFTFLYGQDGMGDASDTTGFFCFTKQGNLQRIRTTFDGVTPNQTHDVPTLNVNDIDIWVNNVDPATNKIIDEDSSLPYRRETLEGKSGEWVHVDLAHAQNIIFNTNPKRNKYEIETLDNNRVRLLFGDGEFADIPSGTFDIWVRSSLDQDIIVSQSSVSNAPASFTYVDSYGRTQTLSFTFSLINTLQNASASEDIEHVRATAPAVYYAQDRMVNGEDYNVFMLQDPSILKMRAINRTFTGDSKYFQWHESTGHYENVKLFGNDGILYYTDKDESVITPEVNIDLLITLYIEPLLSSTDMYVQLASAGVDIAQFRRVFTTTEKAEITAALTTPPPIANANLYYHTSHGVWYASKDSDGPPTSMTSSDLQDPLISVVQLSPSETRYRVIRQARRLVFHSDTTSFWNTNDASRVIDYDTLDSNRDNVVLLQANLNDRRRNVLTSDWTFDVLGQETIDSGPEIALADIHRLAVLPADENYDGVPDNLQLTGLLHPTVPVTPSTISTFGTILPGAGYLGATYNNVPLTGGSGEGAIANITVTAQAARSFYNTSPGSGYTAGTYYNVPLITQSGIGAGAYATIVVQNNILTSIDVHHITPGTGYTSPAYPYTYSNVPLATLSGGGTGAVATAIEVNPTRGAVATYTPQPNSYLYQEGTYYNVPTQYGNGVGATFNVVVTGSRSIGGSYITNVGTGYTPGTWYNVPLVGGSGSGAQATIVVPSGGALLTINITNPGSGYSNGAWIVNIVSVTGSGYGATATVTLSGGAISTIDVWGPGNNYVAGDTITISSIELGSGSGFVGTVASATPNTGGAISTATVTNTGSGYALGDTLTITSYGGHNFSLVVSSINATGPITSITLASGGTNYSASSYLYISPESLGSSFGSSGWKSVRVDTIHTGGVTNVTIPAGGTGTGYAVGDILTASSEHIGGTGSGFQLIVSTVANGRVTSITRTSGGYGYAINTRVSANASYMGGTVSSAFYTYVESLDGGVTNVVKVDGGTGYAPGDLLSADAAYLGGSGDGFGVHVNNCVIDVVLLPFYAIFQEGDVTPKGTGTVSPYPNTVGVISNKAKIHNTVTEIVVKDYVYYTRESTTDPWVFMEATPSNMSAYLTDRELGTGLWTRFEGRSDLNFAWLHRSPAYHLIDPAPTNIIDMFIITKGYYTSLKRWIEDPRASQPTPPTPLDLRTSYNYMLDNRMISDTVVLHPGRVKILFGTKAQTQLQAKLKVIRSPNSTLTDNQIKTKVVTVTRNFFDITRWEFGETFYFSELSAVIHADMPTDLSSVVLVPTANINQFGDLYQIKAREDEVFYPDITVDNVEIVVGYTATNLKFEPM